MATFPRETSFLLIGLLFEPSTPKIDLNYKKITKISAKITKKIIKSLKINKFFKYKL